MKKILIILFVFNLNFNLFSQINKYKLESKKNPLENNFRHYNFDGWYYGTGIVFTNSTSYIHNKLIFDDTTINYITDIKAKSGIGYMAEIGKYKVVSSTKLITYYDYGISYKNISGKQSSILNTKDTSILLNQSFRFHSFSINGNINKVWGISSTAFLTNSLGVNIDYALDPKFSNLENYNYYTYDFSKLFLQLHYRLGFGFIVNDRFAVIPSIEIPLFQISALPFAFEDSHGILQSRYRPIIFNIRLALLSKPDCAKAWDNTEGGNGDPR